MNWMGTRVQELKSAFSNPTRARHPSNPITPRILPLTKNPPNGQINNPGAQVESREGRRRTHAKWQASAGESDTRARPLGLSTLNANAPNYRERALRASGLYTRAGRARARRAAAPRERLHRSRPRGGGGSSALTGFRPSREQFLCNFFALSLAPYYQRDYKGPRPRNLPSAWARSRPPRELQPSKGGARL